MQMGRIKLLLFSLVLVLSSCAENEPEEQTLSESMLYGRWELSAATRNGQPTETLNTTFFEFYEGGEMVNNLAGSRETVHFEFVADDMLIRQPDGRLPADYQVAAFTDSTLTLQLELRNIPFELTLKKK